MVLRIRGRRKATASVSRHTKLGVSVALMFSHVGFSVALVAGNDADLSTVTSRRLQDYGVYLSSLWDVLELACL